MIHDDFDSRPPDPKDYATLEEYEFAMEIYEAFKEKVEGVQKAMEETKTEEQFQEEMTKMGFICVEEEYCENDWCQDKKECMAFALDFFQDMINEDCFFGHMTEEQEVITLRLDSSDCELPPQWKASDTQEGQLIRFCLEIYEAFVFENTHEIPFAELIEKEAMRDFMRNLYFVLQRTLFPGQSYEKEKAEVEAFLKSHAYLEKKKAKVFEKRFKAIF